jgi:AcrR family transcriptional regulator
MLKRHTVRDVAAELGVSPGTIYNYFPGGRSALAGPN